MSALSFPKLPGDVKDQTRLDNNNKGQGIRLRCAVSDEENI